MADIYISNGQSSSGIIVSSGDILYVQNGGTATNIQVLSGGSMVNSTLGTVNLVFVNEGAYLNEFGSGIDICERGGYISCTVLTKNIFAPSVFSGLELNNVSATVHSGTTAAANNVNSGGFLEIFGNGSASGNIVNNGGSMTISSGGIAHDNTVNSRGLIVVSAHGTASGMLVNPGGKLSIISGAEAVDISENGGYVELNFDNTAPASFSPNSFSGLVLYSSASATIHSGTTAISPIVSNGGNLFIFDGGIASDVVVDSGVLIISGGTVNNATVGPGGRIHFNSSGRESGVVWGTATGIIENGGCVIIGSAECSFIPNSFSGLILSSAYMSTTVHSGTTAISTTLLSSGAMAVFEGGLVSGVSFGSGGSLTNYGTVSNAVFSSGGSLMNQGTVSGANLGDGTRLYVYSGATTKDVVMGQNCFIYIYPAGSMSDLTLSSGCSMYIYGSGSASNILISSGGNLLIEPGGTALNVAWTPFAGNLTISGGGVVTFANKTSGIYFGSGGSLLSKANTMNGKVLDSSYEMYIMSGGTASGATINSRGLMHVYSGGVATKNVVNSYGHLNVYSGGKAVSNTVSSGGSLVIHSNGTALNNFATNSGGYILVSSGGTAISDTVVAGGLLSITKEGIASSTIASSGGKIFVGFGGTAKNITISSGGMLTVSSGGTALNVAWTPLEGILDVWQGGYVTFASTVSGVYYDGGKTSVLSNYRTLSPIFVMSGGTAISCTIGGYGNITSMPVYSGGTALNISVDDHGYLDVKSGGFVSSAYLEGRSSSIYGGGFAQMEIKAGGIASNVYIGQYGRLEVFSGGIVVAPSTHQTSSYLFINSGGTMVSALIGRFYGSMTISSGAVLSDTTISAGSLQISRGAIAKGTKITSGFMVVIGGGTVTNTTVYDTLRVSSGGNADGVTLSSGGRIIIGEYGNANDIALSSGGSLVIYAKGTATNIRSIPGDGYYSISNDVQISFINDYSGVYCGISGCMTSHADVVHGVELSNNNYSMFVLQHGIASSTNIQGEAIMIIFSGGTAVDTIVNSGTNSSGGIFIQSGGMAKDSILNDSRSHIVISSGGIATGTTINSGYLDLRSGGILSDTILNNGSLTIGRDCSADGILVNGGTLIISGTTVDSRGYEIPAHGTATGIVENGGYVDVKDGATVNFVSNNIIGMILSSRRATIHSGTTATSAIANLQGGIFVCSDGSANGTVVNSGGSMTITGGIASSTTINEAGIVRVDVGGNADTVTINSSGHLLISSGGVATGLTVGADGRLSVNFGGVVKGNLQIISGASVIAQLGARFMFNLEDRHPGETELINDWSLIQNGDKTYCCVTVSALQCSGTYRLASGAAEFNNTITITVADTPIGAISVGETVRHEYTDYTLSKTAGGVLQLTVDGPMKIINSGTSIRVSSGGAPAYFIENGGYVQVDDGADVTFFPNVFSGITFTTASATLHSGTTATSNTLNSNGRMYIYSSGTAISTTVNNRGSMFVSSGGTATGIILNTGGWGFVSEGGFAADTTIEYGSMFVSSGGSVSGVVVNPGGRLSVNNGGTAIAVVENGGCAMFVDGSVYTIVPNVISGLTLSAAAAIHSGTTGQNITIKKGCSMFVLSGGIISGTILSSGGSMVLSAGGTATGTDLLSGGRLIVSEHGLENNPVINPLGSMSVQSGGTALNIAWTPTEGHLYVADGGYVTFASALTGVYLGSSGHLLSHANSISGSALHSGHLMFVMEGGTITDNSADSFCSMVVQSGGTAENTFLVSYGGLHISQGGQAFNTEVESRGDLRVYGGTATNNTLHSGAMLYVYPSGTVRNTTIDSGGSMFISSGGVVMGVLQIGENANLSMYIGAKYVFDLEDRTPSDAAMINEWSRIAGGNNMEYYITVSADQIPGIYNLAAGAADFNKSITISLEDTQIGTLSAGDTVTYQNADYTLTKDTDGLLQLYVDKPMIVNSGTSFRVSSGGPTIRIIENGGYVRVNSGAEPIFIPNVFSGITFTTASATLHSGTTATSNTLNSNGSMYIYSSGTAIDNTVGRSGYLAVSSGGTATRSIINSGGSMEIFPWGTGVGNIINSWGRADILSDAVVTDTVINSVGTMNIFSRGYASGTIVNEAGHFNVLRGGTTTETTINSGGSMRLAAGATATGWLQISPGAQVSAETGAKFIFNLENRTTSDPALINDWSLITGGANADYSVTVSLDQTKEVGTYQLAGGAATFNNTVTIILEDTAIGTVSVGDTISLQYVDYTLTRDTSGTLDLFVNGVIVVDSGNSVYLSSGCRTTRVIENGGFVKVDNGANVIFTPHVFSGMVLSAASTTLHSGTTATSNTFDSTSLQVSSGGVAIGNTIKKQYAACYYGGTAINNTFSSAFLDIKGGTGIGNTFNSGARAYLSDCIFDSNTFNTGANLIIYAGGSAIGTKVNGGYIEVLNEGIASGAIINSNGSVTISSGGKAIGMTVNSGAVNVSNDGTIVDTVMSSGCSLFLLSGANMTGFLQIASGAQVSASTGARIVFNLQGRTPDDAALINNWSLITGGANADYFITVSVDQADGTYRLADGATAFNNTISVSVGGTGIGTLSVGGMISYQQTVYTLMKESNGALGLLVVNALVVGSGSSVHISSGGPAMRVIEDGGFVKVDNGANVTFLPHVFSGITISSVSATVHSGTTATSNTLISSGSMAVYSGGTAVGNILLSNGFMEIHSGGTAVGNILNNGLMEIHSGGTAIGNTLSKGTFKLSGGIASGNTVQDQAEFICYSGATATGNIFNSGNMEVNSSATAFNNVFSNASLDVKGGTANSNTFNSGASAFVSEGTFDSNTINTGAFLGIKSSGIATGTEVNGGNVVVYDGGSATGTTINSNGAAVVSSGGTAINTTINTGTMSICGGGIITDTAVSSGGRLILSSGAVMTESLQIASGAQVSAETGARIVFNLQGRTPDDPALINNWSLITGGANADYFITISADQTNGSYQLAGGATAFNNTISVSMEGTEIGTLTVGGTFSYQEKKYSLSKTNGNILQLQLEEESTSGMINSGMSVYVSRGDPAITLIENGGFVQVESGASATFGPHTFHGIVFTSAAATVHSGTIASANTLASKGVMHVSSGGIAIKNTVSSGGSLRISAGGTANENTVRANGSMFIASGGSSIDTNIVSGGYLYISSGGHATGTKIDFIGYMYVYGKGIASRTTVNSAGYLRLIAGGTATETTLSSGGSMIVNGIAMSTTVSSGGRMTVSSGGTVTELLQIEQGAMVSACANARIVFNLESRTIGNDPIINDWSLITGSSAAVCYVTVTASQTLGTYTLAGGASGFNQSITVKVNNEELGGVLLNSPLEYNERRYSISKTANGDLQFTIGPCAGEDDVYVETELIGSTVTRYAYVIGTNVTFEDDVIGGTIYGCIGTSTPVNREMTIDRTTARRFYATGVFKGIAQTGAKKLATANLSGSTFAKGLFLGADSVNSVINMDAKLTATSAAGNLIMGGSNIGKQSDYSINNLTITGNVNMTLTDCISTNFCCGGSLLANECQEERTGDTVINIIGGTYDTVAGGSLFQSKTTNNMYSIINGDISISVSGSASIQSLNGGSVAVYVGPTRKETINGNISILVDVSNGAQIEKSIYAGGACFCNVNGTSDITIKGSGSNDVLSTNYIIGASGYAAGDAKYVSQTTSLNFTNFNGTVNSRITFFDTYTIDGTSSVNFTDYKSEFGGKDWYISADSADMVSVVLSGNNLARNQIHNMDFNNSVLNLSCDLEAGDEWTIFKILDDNESLQTLYNFSDTSEFQLNGEDIEWDDDDLCGYSDTYQIEYRFDDSEGTGMLVASLI